MPEGSIDPDTRLVLVNAVYFNGEWENKFPANQTYEQDFTYLDGTKSQVETMHYRHDFNYFEDGTEAGAATGISAGIESLPEFIELNSPFIFVIRHNETGVILFIGRVLDPKAS